MGKRKRIDGEMVIGIRGRSTVEVGPWDSQRWTDQGGFAFGLSTTIYLDEDGPDFARVSIGGIAPHTTDTARLRIAGYTLATDIATIIEARVGAGDSMGQVLEWIKEHYKSQYEN